MGVTRGGVLGCQVQVSRFDGISPSPSQWSILAAACAACSSSDEGGRPTLTWYINPDNGGQKTLAEKCSKESDGAFDIEIQVLPNEADAQREQLVRRLAAQDASVDLMSLDPPFVAEFANAGYLLPITDPADVEQLTDGVLDAPLETANWKGKLVATPFWANTQLLWYRKSVAAAAGVDPTAPDFTWDEMIDAAEKEKKRIGVQARRYEGYMVWINALVGLGRRSDHRERRSGSPTPRRRWPRPPVTQAAEVVGHLARSPAAPADLSTAGEEEARSLFQSDDGRFMVNWPYVYQARQRGGRRPARSTSRWSTTSAGPATRGWTPTRTAHRRSVASTWASATSPSTPTRRSPR